MSLPLRDSGTKSCISQEAQVQKRAFHERLKYKNLRFTRGSSTKMFISQEAQVQKRRFHTRLRYRNVHFTRGSSTKMFILLETQVQKHAFHKRLRYKNVRFTRGSGTKTHFTRGEQRLKDPLSAISASSNCHLSQCISETQTYNHSTYIQLPISSTAKITKPFCLLLEPNLIVYEALINTSHKACLSWDFPGDPEIKINIFKKILKACLSCLSEIIKCISSFFN